MSKYLKWIVAPAILAAGLLWAAPNEAKAQGFSLRIGSTSFSSYGYRGYGGYGANCYTPYRSSVNLYYRAPSYGNYRYTSRIYGGHVGRGRGHYDYYPGHFDYHNGHYDYHPAHFDYHGPGHRSHGH